MRYLEEAKKAGGLGAELIVIVARDSNVERSKRRKPIMSEGQRRVLVESLEVVDQAVLGFEEFDMGDVIERIKPDVIALGYDQNNMEARVRDYVTKHGLAVKVVKIGKFGEDALDSSSKIRQKIIENFSR